MVRSNTRSSADKSLKDDLTLTIPGLSAVGNCKILSLEPWNHIIEV